MQEIVIDPDAVDPEDVEMLQDMVLAAVNEGIRAAQERAAEAVEMGGIAGGPAASGAAGCGLPAHVMMHPAPADRLIAELGKLPGIGRRTAQRLAFHILRAR